MNLNSSALLRNFNKPQYGKLLTNKANLRDLTAATDLLFLLQIVNFWAHVTWKFDGRPKKTIQRLLYTMSSCVHHFKAIVEFKLELQSGNDQFVSKLVICSPVTSELYGWPRKTIGHFFYATSSFVHHFIAICVKSKWRHSTETPNLCQNRRFSVPCDLEIWRKTLKNNRAPLLCYVKLCASLHSHLWNGNGVTVRKRQIWVTIGEFFVPGDLEIWQMTLKNNRAPLLRYFKLFALFHSQPWIRTGVTVRTRIS